MRLSKEEHTAIIAQLSYDLEPVTPLPTWNALAMEVVHLCNEREDMVKQLEEARKVLHFYADFYEDDPNDGPWGVNSDDFGKVARAFLTKGE